MVYPDKLYVSVERSYETTAGNLIQFISCHTNKKEDSVEFIRKDALIEWVSEMQKKNEHLSLELVITLSDLLNKINSL